MDGAPASRSELPWPQTPAQPPVRNLEAPRYEGARPGVLNRSLHPQTQERASRETRTPVLAFMGPAPMKRLVTQRGLTRVPSANCKRRLHSHFREDFESDRKHRRRV